MATSVTGKLSIEDFERLPQEEADFHELVDGELVDVSGNTPKHNIIRDELLAVLLPIVKAKRSGRVLSEQEYNFNGNAHGPDLSFFGPDKVAILAVDRRVQPFVPDLAIEVASPNDKFAALLRKVHRYRDCGTSEVWVIEPELRKVFVFSSLGDRVLSATDQLKTPLIPDFTQPVSDLFSQFPQ